MPVVPLFVAQLSGIAGILGALVTGAGDLLYHHIPGSRQSIEERMSSLPTSRLITAGSFGLIGSWLYFFGAFHLYYAFQPGGRDFAFSISIAFALVAICYGVGHAAYFAIGSGAKIARENGLDIAAAGKAGGALFSRLVLITYIPVTIASLLMLYGILSRRSAYPIWMAVFLPVIPYLLRIPILKILPSRVQEVIRDSYDNFVLLVFFVLSTIVLWNTG